MEFIVMVTVIIWGIIITIIVVTVEFSTWKSNREMNRRISKLEKCKHGKGKETQETKEAEKSRCRDAGRGADPAS